MLSGSELRLRTERRGVKLPIKQIYLPRCNSELYWPIQGRTGRADTSVTTQCHISLKYWPREVFCETLWVWRIQNKHIGWLRKFSQLSQAYWIQLSQSCSQHSRVWKPVWASYNFPDIPIGKGPHPGPRRLRHIYDAWRSGWPTGLHCPNLVLSHGCLFRAIPSCWPSSKTLPFEKY